VYAQNISKPNLSRPGKEVGKLRETLLYFINYASDSKGKPCCKNKIK